MQPFVRKMYHDIMGEAARPYFTNQDYQSLTALKCVLSYNKYGGYCIPESSRHRPAAQRVLLNDVYEAHTINFMTQHCGDGDIIHAGAYFGDFFPALSRACAAGAKVWTFEPNPENYRCAQITILMNDLENIVLTKAGLGERNEVLYIKTKDEAGVALGGASQITADNSQNALEETQSVQIVTIDDVVPDDRKISILQLDVEGHEQSALTGALATIRRCRPIILVEVLPESDLLESKWFAENILSLGYTMKDVIQRNSVFICDSVN